MRAHVDKLELTNEMNYDLTPVFEPEYNMFVCFNVTITPQFWERLRGHIYRNVYFRNCSKASFVRVADKSMFVLTLAPNLSCDVDIQDAIFLENVFISILSQ